MLRESNSGQPSLRSSAYSGWSTEDAKSGSYSANALEQGRRAARFVTPANDGANFEIEINLLCNFLNLTSRLQDSLYGREDLMVVAWHSPN